MTVMRQCYVSLVATSLVLFLVSAVSPYVRVSAVSSVQPVQSRPPAAGLIQFSSVP